jgi:DNA-binding NtrC family response regulator
LPNVLIIDDEPLFREALEASLLTLGHDVRSAENAHTGFQMISEHAPDVVVSDILMPTADGIEVLREIKKRWPTIPVIVMSGGGKVDYGDILTWAKSLGASAAFGKPFDMHALSDTITELAAARQPA